MPKGIPGSRCLQPCAIEGCDLPVKARGWCTPHYSRWHKTGDPVTPDSRRIPASERKSRRDPTKPWTKGEPLPTTCTIGDCTRPYHRSGMCQHHYRNLRLYGGVSENRIRTRKICTVDECERLSVSNGFCTKHEWRYRTYGDPLMKIRMSCDGPCLIAGCPRVRVGKGLCKTHYYELIVLSPEQVAKIYAGWERRPMCKNGHLWLPETTVVTTHPSTNRPSRVCGLCNRNHNTRRHAVMKAPDADSIDWYQLMESSGWICQLCGYPIEREARWPQPLFGSVDHIVPLSRGGRHTWENVQATHLYCNLSKNANDAPKELPPGYRPSLQLALPVF